MKWWLVLFAISCAVALPHERNRHSRRVVAQRRVQVPPVPVQARVKISPPVKAPVRRVQAVRVVPTKATSQTKKPLRTVPVPAPYPVSSPSKTYVGTKKVTTAHKVPAIHTFPGVKTLSREESEALQRQIQQWQIAVVGGQYPPPATGYPSPSPPGGPPSPAAPGSYPGVAGPGTIWIQVPAGSYPPPAYPPPPPVQPIPVEPSVTTEEASHESEGESPVSEEIPAPVGEPTGEGESVPAVPEEGVAPTEGGGETPTEEGVAPEEEVPETPSPPSEETPGEEPPAEGTAPEEETPGVAPEGEAPAEEIPAEEDTGGEDVAAGGESPTAGGDQQEEKLVHCKQPRGQFAHESSCSKFYNCWDDVVVEQSCPNGLVFSEQKSYCDYPENVDCKEMPVEGPAMPIEDKGGCATPYGSYRSKTNCSEFFICVNGDPVKFACPSSLFYNDELGVCDYPYRVDCQNPPAPESPPAEGATGEEESSPEQTSGPEEPAPAEPSAPSTEQSGTPDAVRRLPQALLVAGSPCWHNNVYPLDRACGRVSVCRSGATSILSCPRGMSFDVYKHRCLPGHIARC